VCAKLASYFKKQVYFQSLSTCFITFWLFLVPSTYWNKSYQPDLRGRVAC
jgi:hypothetical protein